MHALANLLQAHGIVGVDGFLDEIMYATLQLSLDASTLNSVNLTHRRELAIQQAVDLSRKRTRF